MSNITYTTLGWSEARRKSEFKRYLAYLQQACGLSSKEAVTYVMKRTGKKSIHAVYSWTCASSEHSACPWYLLDLLLQEASLLPFPPHVSNVVNTQRRATPTPPAPRSSKGRARSYQARAH